MFASLLLFISYPSIFLSKPNQFKHVIEELSTRTHFNEHKLFGGELSKSKQPKLLIWRSYPTHFQKSTTQPPIITKSPSNYPVVKDIQNGRHLLIEFQFIENLIHHKYSDCNFPCVGRNYIVQIRLF